MKKASRLLALAVAALIATQVHAEGSYLGVGAGPQFDLGALGLTITKDGLNTKKWNNFDTTQGNLPSSQQELIPPENEIDVYKHSGLMTGHLEGPMTGGLVSLFWEKENSNTFWRVGVDYTQKILGGHDDATFAGIQWLNITWNYKSVVVPLYWGIKAGVGESASVYGALGINYYNGGWGIEGTNNGQIPYELSNGRLITGAHYNEFVLTRGQAPATGGGPILGEKINFHVTGQGFNFLMGVENKLQSGNKTFFEIEYLIAGKMDNEPVKTLGSVNGLASTGNISYPINLSGTRFKFGYKVAM